MNGDLQERDERLMKQIQAALDAGEDDRYVEESQQNQYLAPESSKGDTKDAESKDDSKEDSLKL